MLIYDKKIERTRQEIARIMGDKFVVRTMKSELGGVNRTSYCFRFFGVNPTNGIAMNCPLNMQIWVFDIPTTERTGGKFSFECDGNKLFRKINAQTFENLLDKLIAYFEKNKKKFEQIWLEDRGEYPNKNHTRIA
jgi:hypothetical protein